MKSKLLAFVAVAAALGCNQKASEQPAPAPARNAPAATTKQTAVGVTDVLGWRSAYGDLLGKPKAAAVDRFGEASTQDRPNVWTWEPSQKTNGRMITIAFADRPPRGASEVKIYASDQENLDPLEVLKRAPQFNFVTGTYRDSVTNYLIAETKDGRSALQFDVDGNVIFSAVTFREAGAPAPAALEKRK